MPRFIVFETAASAEDRVDRLIKIRQLFEKDWKSYRKFAWKKNALLPISDGWKDQFLGWAATLVDSLATALDHRLTRRVRRGRGSCCRNRLWQLYQSRVNIFETNIRYLGGLMAAYDLSEKEGAISESDGRKQEFQDKAQDMLTAVSSGKRTDHVNGGVLDVTIAAYSVPKEDYMEVWSPDSLRAPSHVLMK
ncbi:hypothetical protein ED733_001523 [Metarhizium rileyi]|uniref:alpha-1,2-Mannosidase n=1 Tax=Metarhizium rileyi (strain RCEF 4871) TaxID=1649241 RepID=A0A5C6G8R8_METRR|nr:hypothetical protein ED733_001523 [Metarhizium rileyi]